DATRYADDHTVRRDRFHHHGSGGYLGGCADDDGSQNDRAGTDDDIILERRMAFAALQARATEGDALIQRAVLADLGCLSDDDGHPVVDEQSTTDLGSRMVFHAVKKRDTVQHKRET